MNDATRAPQKALHPATLRLPVSFAYPLGAIVARMAIGLAMLALGGALLLHATTFTIIGAIALGLFGGLVTISNLRALTDSEWRKIVLDEDGVEIRYGLSRRHYRFLNYSDYRISRLGLRRFLTALPIETERALGKRVERMRVTLYDRPAFLTPMPMLGGGAPASLLEWQSILNELRHAAVAAAGLTADFEQESREERAEEVRRAASWRMRERAGAKPSRLSRGAYTRRQIIVGIAFLAILLVPIGLAYAVRHGIIVVCGATGHCAGIEPGLQNVVMVVGPALAIALAWLGNAWLMVRRAHDLDLDLRFWTAALDLLSRRSALRLRLSREEGTSGTNRFGPMPSN